MLVVDAGVLVPAVLDDGATGRRVRSRLGGEALAVPELADLEVVSVVRRQVLRRAVTPDRAGRALAHLADLPAARHGHRPFLDRCWELRDALTAYDAVYVALAEVLGATLLTADERMARSPGPRCPVEVVD
ncbi:type II toxin-antitoxin system VapC family toxin [Klenkia sp. PcliD-1-E]|uniref:type II toxin-antitoxin system VapC family toxin n=1 Tax=Klenkia sp. PcliD-1-E TaxID=2954492 RepID=UPI00209793C6|nr:type II toxin-antitoxin system VapC family toxin [Klenkia sp. PcliD-1-E]MCO7219759.1 type II toxin-antitoxin system VapC family toxin [Klenkia sp. PcliD-1-E]